MICTLRAIICLRLYLYLIMGKGSNMLLYFSKRFKYAPRLKFGSFIPSPFNYWYKYAFMGVNWPPQNIRRILHFFNCPNEFSTSF